MPKPVDNDLKFKHLEFHTLDGKKVKSKERHFHDVELSKIVAMEVHLKYETHRLDVSSLPSTFVEFVHFRSGGLKTRFIPGGGQESVQINTWTIGWTDGDTEYLTEYDFKTGELLRSYTQTRDDTVNPTHFHPQSRTRKAPKKPLTPKGQGQGSK